MILKKKFFFKANYLIVILISLLSFVIGVLFHDAKVAYFLKQAALNKTLFTKNLINSFVFKDIPELKIDIPFKTRDYLEKNLIIANKYNDLKLSSNIIIANDQTLDIIDVNKSFTKESSRFDYISKSVDGFLEKPLFGNGFSSFRANHSYFDEQNRLIRKPVTHNDFAQVLYEMGLLGFSSFLYLFLFNINRYRYYGKGNLLSTIMLSQLILLGVSLNSINLIDHAIFWIVMALTLIKNTNQKLPRF